MAATAGLSLLLAVPRLAHRPLWLDEAFTVGATRELGTTLRHTGGTMALYYALVTPLARITDDAFWLRLPSALFAAATVVVVYLIGHHIGGRRLAAVAAVLLASSWFLARYAMEARGYALAMLLVAISWLGLLRAVAASDEGDEVAARRWWWVFGVATVLAPLAHGISAIQVPVQVVALLLLPGGRRHLKRLAPVFAVLAGELVGLFAIGAGEVANWIPPLNWLQISTFQRLLFGRGPARWLVMVAFVAGIVLAVREARRDRTERGWATLVPVLWALGLPLALIALSVVRPYAAGRYALSSLPAVSLVVASALVRLRRPATYGLCLLLVAALLVDQPRVQRNGLEDWPRLVRRVGTEAQPGDHLLMSLHLRAPFDYALRHGGHDPGLTPLSPTDSIGPVRRFYDPAPGSMRERLLHAPAGTVWLVYRSKLELPHLEHLLADPAVRARFRRTNTWRFAGPLYLVRLEPRDSAAP